MSFKQALIVIILACTLKVAVRPSAAEPATNVSGVEAQNSLKMQLDAATVDAREALRQDILSFPLTADLTVRQFIDRTVGGSDDVSHVILNAQQRGGTRWTTDQTCEIRLEVSGADVTGALRPILSAHAARLPASRESLEKGLNELNERTFSSIGKSTGPRNLARLRPGAKFEVWRNVGEAQRREAIVTAESNAVAHVVQSLRPVSIGGNNTLDDALNVPQVDSEIRDWIGGRPVTEIVFGDDLSITLMLSAPPEELWPVVQSALIRNHLGPPVQDAPAWVAVRAAMLHDAAPAEGRSVAIPTYPPTAPANAAMPREPPDWVARRLETDGASKGSGLRTARAAETIAIEGLRKQIEALPLNSTTTLGQAAKVNPGIARALDNVIRRGPAREVDYRERGVVKVRVSLDMEEVWRALHSER